MELSNIVGLIRTSEWVKEGQWKIRETIWATQSDTIIPLGNCCEKCLLFIEKRTSGFCHGGNSCLTTSFLCQWNCLLYTGVFPKPEWTGMSQLTDTQAEKQRLFTGRHQRIFSCTVIFFWSKLSFLLPCSVLFSCIFLLQGKFLIWAFKDTWDVFLLQLKLFIKWIEISEIFFSSCFISYLIATSTLCTT